MCIRRVVGVPSANNTCVIHCQIDRAPNVPHTLIYIDLECGTALVMLNSPSRCMYTESVTTYAWLLSVHRLVIGMPDDPTAKLVVGRGNVNIITCCDIPCEEAQHGQAITRRIDPSRSTIVGVRGKRLAAITSITMMNAPPPPPHLTITTSTPLNLTVGLLTWLASGGAISSTEPRDRLARSSNGGVPVDAREGGGRGGAFSGRTTSRMVSNLANSEAFPKHAERSAYGEAATGTSSVVTEAAGVGRREGGSGSDGGDGNSEAIEADSDDEFGFMADSGGNRKLFDVLDGAAVDQPSAAPLAEEREEELSVETFTEEELGIGMVEEFPAVGELESHVAGGEGNAAIGSDNSTEQFEKENVESSRETGNNKEPFGEMEEGCSIGQRERNEIDSSSSRTEKHPRAEIAREISEDDSNAASEG